MASRVDIRETFSMPERMRLAENDLDGISGEMAAIRRLLIGILVSTTGASIMLAVSAVSRWA